MGVSTITRTDIAVSGTYNVVTESKMHSWMWDQTGTYLFKRAGAVQLADTSKGDIYIASVNPSALSLAGTDQTATSVTETADGTEEVASLPRGITSLACTENAGTWSTAVSYTDGASETLVSTSPVVGFAPYSDTDESGVEFTFADGTTRRRVVSVDVQGGSARTVSVEIVSVTAVSETTAPALHFTMSDGTTQDVPFPTLVNGDTTSY